MRGFRNRLYSFMYGRNGFDKFGRFLFVLYMVLVIIQWIISFFVPPVVSFITSILVMLLAVYMIFRSFSRNLVKRQAENVRYLNFASKFKTHFSLQKSKIRDRKTHIYRKCPTCKAVLRLKKIKGKHRAVCPRCSHSFDIRVR